MDHHLPGDSRPSTTPAARRRHYAQFYGLEPLPGTDPVAIVWGNCQAESLRLALSGPDLATIRTPPVHELTAEDLPHLDRLLTRVSLFITQPIRDDYRSLPIGSQQMRSRLRADTPVVTIPVIRFTGLYPNQAIIRPPEDRSLVPPIVPYHDLRILVRAAGMPALTPLSSSAVRAIAEHSLEQLRQREVRHETVQVSDLLGDPTFEQMRTMNHPGNDILGPVADRIRRKLGFEASPGVARRLLDSIHGPREAEVITALGLNSTPEPLWRINGRLIDCDELRSAHLAWYERHPTAITAGLRRYRRELELMGAPV